jgi:hypothetical protein
MFWGPVSTADPRPARGIRPSKATRFGNQHWLKLLGMTVELNIYAVIYVSKTNQVGYTDT